MEIQPKALLAQLHKARPQERVFAFCGDESYYRDKLLQALTQALFNDTAPEDREIITYNGPVQTNQLLQLEETINSYPFFSGHRLVIIGDAGLWTIKNNDGQAKKELQDKFKDIVANGAEYSTILLLGSKMDKRTKLYKWLSKEGVFCPCEGLKTQSYGAGNPLSQWLDEEAERYGSRLEPAAKGLLLEYMEPLQVAPLALLEQELAKLALYAGENTTWTRQQVEDIFAQLPEVDAFALCEAIAKGQTLQVLELLERERRKNTNIMPLCGKVAFEVRSLLQLRELMDTHSEREIIAMTKSSAYMVRKRLPRAAKFTLEQLTTAHLELAELNIGVSRGGRQLERLEEILLKLLAR